MHYHADTCCTREGVPAPTDLPRHEYNQTYCRSVLLGSRQLQKLIRWSRLFVLSGRVLCALAQAVGFRAVVAPRLCHLYFDPEAVAAVEVVVVDVAGLVMMASVDAGMEDKQTKERNKRSRVSVSPRFIDQHGDEITMTSFSYFDRSPSMRSSCVEGWFERTYLGCHSSWICEDDHSICPQHQDERNMVDDKQDNYSRRGQDRDFLSVKPNHHF